MASDEFEPYVVCRVEGTRVDCALWIMPDGRKSLALFFTADKASQYQQGLKLGTDWRVVRPSQFELVKMFKASLAGGVRQAVLDPDTESANRIFDLREVLSGMGELEG